MKELCFLFSWWHWVQIVCQQDDIFCKHTHVFSLSRVSRISPTESWSPLLPPHFLPFHWLSLFRTTGWAVSKQRKHSSQLWRMWRPWSKTWQIWCLGRSTFRLRAGISLCHHMRGWTSSLGSLLQGYRFIHLDRIFMIELTLRRSYFLILAWVGIRNWTWSLKEKQILTL